MTTRTRLIIGATLLMITYLLFAWIVFHSAPPRILPAQFSEAEKAQFKKRLKYHGLDRQVSIVYDWPEKPYFIRDGKRCRF